MNQAEVKALVLAIYYSLATNPVKRHYDNENVSGMIFQVFRQ